MSQDPLSTDFKRLLALNNLGIRIEAENGHRYLCYHQTDRYGLCEEKPFDQVYYEATGEPCPIKEYGSPTDAMNVIDKCLEKMGLPPLLEMFNSWGAGDILLNWGYPPERGKTE